MGIQYITFSRIKQGRGCPYCGRERTIEASKKDIDYEADRKLAESKGFEYKGSHFERDKTNARYHMIDFICPNHKDIGIQSMRIGNMKRSTVSGCRYCNPGHIQYISPSEIAKINPDVEILDDYKRKSDYVNCICKKHNVHMYKKISEILDHKGCYLCGIEKVSENLTYSLVEANNIIHKINPHVDILEYNGAQNKALCHCNKHDKDFYKHFNVLKTASSGCDICYKERMIELCGVDKDTFINRLSISQPDVMLVGEYISLTEPTMFYCKRHNHYFENRPRDILSRSRCCDKSQDTYKQEQICSYLELQGHHVIREKTFENCKDKHVLPFDCYLDDLNVVVEYDGEQHYIPIRFGGCSDGEMNEKYLYTKRHDEIKTKFCKDNGIHLIRIPFFNFENYKEILDEELKQYA